MITNKDIAEILGWTEVTQIGNSFYGIPPENTEKYILVQISGLKHKVPAYLSLNKVNLQKLETYWENLIK